MPSVFIACSLGLCAGVAVIDRQMQRIHIGANRARRNILIRIDTAGRVIIPVPVIHIACLNMIGHRVMNIYRKMQGIGTGASVIVDIVIYIFTTHGKLVILPHIALTCMLVKVLMGAMPNGEVQVYHTVASNRIGPHKCGRVCTLSISHAMPVKPVTGRCIGDTGSRMVHRERQHINTIHAGKRLKYRISINACCGIGMAPPQKTRIANRPNQRIGHYFSHTTPFGQTELFSSDKTARHSQRQQQKTGNIIILSHKYVIHYKIKYITVQLNHSVLHRKMQTPRQKMQVQKYKKNTIYKQS